MLSAVSDKLHYVALMSCIVFAAAAIVAWRLASVRNQRQRRREDDMRRWGA